MFEWSDIVTAAGAAAVAATALILVQLLKAGIPAIFETITGGTMAFVITAVIYAIGAVVLYPTFTDTANNLLALFLSWVASATAALGLHSIANNGARTFVQSAPKDNPPAPK